MFNTFVNNSLHYEMGGRTGGLGSSNTVVANNIFQGGGNMASISSSAPYTGTWSNNIHWLTSSTGNMPTGGYITVNPLLAKDSNGVYHLQSGSPAINAGRGVYDYYGVYSAFSYVTTDMDGQPRDASADIGADEFSAVPITARILTAGDVGPTAGLMQTVRIIAVTANGGTLRFTATNSVPGRPCLIISSTNLTLPLNQWPVLATNSFDASGTFSFTNVNALNASETYYALRLQ